MNKKIFLLFISILSILNFLHFSKVSESNLNFEINKKDISNFDWPSLNGGSYTPISYNAIYEGDYLFNMFADTDSILNKKVLNIEHAYYIQNETASPIAVYTYKVLEKGYESIKEVCYNLYTGEEMEYSIINEVPNE